MQIRKIAQKMRFDHSFHAIFGLITLNKAAMDDAREGWTLTAAAMAQSALAMNLALLHSDLPEARFRARLLHYQAISTGDPSLEDATALVVQLLGLLGRRPAWRASRPCER